MPPSIVRAAGCLAAVALVVGCTPQGGGPQGSVPPAAPSRSDRQPLAVLTSVFPATALTQAVAGDCAAVSQLLPPGTGPHSYRASPGDLLRVGQAELLVINGLGLESFLDKLVQGAADSGLTVVDASAALTPIPVETPQHDTAADHGHGEAGHSHAGHSHGPDNPHGWLDPRNAALQVGTIRDALIREDPGCAEGYRERAAAYTQRLEALDRRLATALAPYRGRTLVFQHDVAPYLAQRYGLNSTFLVSEPEMAPGPADLRRVDDAVRRQGLKGVLVDPGEPPGSLVALVRDRQLVLVPFDPLEAASVPVAQAPDHFLAVMERNGTALVEVLEGSRPAGG